MNQISTFDLLESYLKANFGDKSLLLWQFWFVDGGGCGSTNDAIREFCTKHGVDAGQLPLATEGDWIHLEIEDEDLMSKMIGDAHLNKWGIGSITYFWNKKSLKFGRD